MNYKEKLKYAEEASELLLGGKSTAAIKAKFLDQGLYEKDVLNIMSSADKFIEEKVGLEIRELILSGKHDEIESKYSDMEPAALGQVLSVELKKISGEQKKKVAQMIRQKQPLKEIYAAVDTRFYPKENIDAQWSVSQKVKEMNSGGNRTMNIIGGAAITVVGIIATIFAWQAGYIVGLTIGIMIFGLSILARGFTTVENPFD